VSAELRFAADGAGNYELSLPLATLGLAAKPGASLRGDLGILRGNGFQPCNAFIGATKPRPS